MPTPQRQPPGVATRKSKPGIRLNKIIPIIFILIFATIILRDQFPQVNDFIESLIHPKQLAAVKICRKTALLQSETPNFARLIKRGKANPTQKGFLVDHLVMGEMAEAGGERRISITCHVNTLGEVIMIHRKPDEAPHPPEEQQPDDDN